jgi:elongation factor P--beta-lysine ligase
MAKISVLQAFNEVLKIAQSKVPGPTKRATVADAMKRYRASRATGSDKNRLRKMLLTASKAPDMPGPEQSIFAYAVIRLGDDDT